MSPTLQAHYAGSTVPAPHPGQSLERLARAYHDSDSPHTWDLFVYLATGFTRQQHEYQQAMNLSLETFGVELTD